ncbi:MAG: hypothetical protein ACRYG8_22625 [Janthinobacterium lividum]
MSENESPQAAAPPIMQSNVMVRESGGGWQLDKSIGLAVMLTVLAQFVVCIWYASGAYAELADHEKRLSHIEMTIEERTKARDEQMRLLTDTLSDLRAKLAEVGAGVEYLKETRAGRR